jgi:cbb3-type cytochrome oxidase maturation protein
VTILYLLIPLGLVLLVFSLWAFFWAVGTGQFDDLESPAVQILLDDDFPPPPANDRSAEPPGRAGDRSVGPSGGAGDRRA